MRHNFELAARWACRLAVIGWAGVLPLAAGCAAPDLGQRPFLCNNGKPECPDNYVCVHRPSAAPVCEKKTGSDGGGLVAKEASVVPDVRRGGDLFIWLDGARRPDSKK